MTSQEVCEYLHVGRNALTRYLTQGLEADEARRRMADAMDRAMTRKEEMG
jgi:hypothetical protein